VEEDDLIDFAAEASRRCSCALRILFGFRASFLPVQATDHQHIMLILITCRHASLVAHASHCAFQGRKTSLANPLRADVNLVLRLLTQSHSAYCTHFCLGYVVVIATFVSKDSMVAHC
jgi:hypothetical protein